MAIAATSPYLYADASPLARRAPALLTAACYLLAFATFENLAGLGAPDRAVPETLHFDAIAAIKAASRIFAFFAAMVGLLSLPSTREGLHVWRLMAPWLIFAIWGVLTSLWSPMPAYSFGHAMEFALLSLLAVLAGLVCDRPGRVHAVLVHACLIQCLYLLALLLMALASPDRASILRPRLETENPFFAADAQAMYIKNPAEIACVAALAFVLLVALRLAQPTRRVRLFFWPGLALSGAFLLITQTRALVVTAVILASLAAIVLGGRRLIAVAALSLSLLFVAYCIADPYLDRVAAATGKIEAFLKRGQSTHELRGLGGRMENWTGVAQGLTEHPTALFHGFGYSMATPSGKRWVDGAFRRYTGHNIILDVLAGTGLLGLIPFLLGAAALLGHALLGFTRRLGAIHFLGILMLLYSLLSGIFGDSIVGPIDPTSVAVFVVIGAGLGSAAHAVSGRFRQEAQP